MSNVNGSKWLRPEKRAAIYERDNWECAYCGRGPRDKRSPKQASLILTLDHLTPRCQGGDNSARNLVTACQRCNSSRQEKSWREFAPGGAVDRIEWLIEQPVDVTLGKAIIASLAGDPMIEAR